MRTVLLTILLGLLLAGPGCVTRQEGTAEVRCVDFTTRKPVDDGFLVVIESTTAEKQGYYWVIQDAPAGYLVPRSTKTLALDAGGTKVHQPGHVLFTAGPYTRGTLHNWEYWIFRKGYLPERFTGATLIRAYEDETPLIVGLEREQPGEPYSDEHVLDGARRLQDVLDLLPEGDPNAGAAVRIAVTQLRGVKDRTFRPRFRKDAESILNDLAPARVRFPASPRLADSPEPEPLPKRPAVPTSQPIAPAAPAEPAEPTTRPGAKTTPQQTQAQTPQPLSELSFRAAPQNPVAQASAPLPDKLIEEYLRELEAQGPQTGHRQNRDYLWFPCAFSDPRPDLITAYRSGRRYILLGNRPDDVLLPRRKGQPRWGLAKLRLARDRDGNPAIDILFDIPGKKLFRTFTRRHLNRPVAILIDQTAQTVPIVKTVIAERAQITGQFTPEQAEQLIDALQAGMPPQSP